MTTLPPVVITPASTTDVSTRTPLRARFLRPLMSPAVTRAAGTPNTTRGSPPFRNTRARASLLEDRWSWIQASVPRSMELTAPSAPAAMATCHQRMEGVLDEDGRCAGALVGSAISQARTIVLGLRGSRVP